MNPIWTTINEVTVTLVCGYAVLVGSWRERLAGAVYAAASLFLGGFGVIPHRASLFLEFTADVLIMPGFLTVNRKSPYAWTRWMLAFQTLSFVPDIIKLMGNPAYFAPCTIAQGVLSYGVLASLLTGTISTQARKRREREGQINPASGDDGSA